jgi:tetratricopeptide (TPR) repeat protein
MSLLVWPARFAPLYSRWIVRQPLFAAELGLLLVLALTPAGDDLGLRNLFWHHVPAVQTAAGAAVAALAVLLWALSYLRHPMPAAWAAHAKATLRLLGPFPRSVPRPPYPGLPSTPPAQFRLVLGAMAVPLMFLLLAVAILRSITAPPGMQWPGPWPLLAGACGTVAAAWLALGQMPWAPRSPRRRWLCGAAALILIVGAHAAALSEEMGRRVTAVAALCLILGEFALALHLTHRRPLARIAGVVALSAYISWSNSGLYKLRYPGLKESYSVAAVSIPARPGPQPGTDADTKSSPPRLTPPPPKEAFERADKLIALALKDREALARFRAAQGDPERPAYWIRQGLAFLESSSRLDDTIAAFSEAIRLDPKSKEERSFLARWLANYAAELETKGNPEAASEYLRQAIRLAPDDTMVIEFRATILDARGDYGAALADYELVNKLVAKPKRARPSNSRIGTIRMAETRFRRGLERLKSENYPGAEVDFWNVIDSLKSYFLDDEKEKNILRDSGPYQPPPELVALRVQSEEALAITLLMEDDSPDAEKSLGSSATRGKGSPLALWGLGAKLARRGALDQAISAYTKAAEMDPLDASALEACAACRARQGREKEAAADRDRATRRQQRAAALAAVSARDRAREILRQRSLQGVIFSDLYLRDAAKAPVGPAEGEGQVDDLGALEAWKTRNGGEKHGMVVLATSGGGIAAAAWTVATLATIEEQDHEFPRRLRVAFGASGGMVGAAAYVATLPTPPGGRAEGWARDLIDAVSADSLTPVARRMLLGDLPSILAWWDQGSDRGMALEAAWATHVPAMADPMSALGAGERAGWRPSLVVSPMLVEDAAPMLISNLNLGGLGGHEEFFGLYEKDYGEFSLGTALRMNAAFPLVSPGAYLPAVPPSTATPEGRPARRIVDAGYFDNYGVGLACAWIERHRGWLLANTSGVLLLQLRAYPIRPEPAKGAPTRSANPWQFLTTAVEGAGSARQHSMISRNDERVRQLRQWFNEEGKTEPFFETILLQPDSERYAPPLGWSLTAADRERLDEAIKAIDVGPVVRRLRAE